MSVSETVEFRTSGSTGGPKVVVKTLKSLERDALTLFNSLPELFRARPYVIATIREEHMFGALWRVRLPRLAGCAVHPETVISVEELCAAAEGHHAVLLLTTPSFLEVALKNDDFSSIRPLLTGIVTSGSLLSGDLSKRVCDAVGVSATEIFGSTETGSVAWRRQDQGELWTLFDGVEACVDDDGFISVDSEFSLTRPFTMGDKVEFAEPRRFILHGRGDRNVKILEKYVSLPEIESLLQSHPLVDKAHAVASDDPVQRIQALVELSAEGRKALKESTYSAVTRRLKREIHGIEAFAFPRRIRYLNDFPYNEQGKLPLSSVLAILSSRYQEPVQEDVDESEEHYSSTLTFIPDAVYFDGHFQEFKILPGVAQLDLVERLIRKKWRMPAFAGEVSRLKFQRPVQPYEQILLEVKKAGEGVFSFSLKCSETLCTSGVFKYRDNTARSRVLAGIGAFLTAASLLACPAFAEPMAEFENAMRRAFTSSAAWTMTRTWTDSPIRMISSGTVSCSKGRGVLWRVEKPLSSSIDMRASEMIFSDMKGCRRVENSKLPHYEEITKAIDGFLDGGAMEIEKLFKVGCSKAGAGWRIELIPRRRDLGYLLKSISLSGADTLNEAILTYASGERMALKFKAIPGQVNSNRKVDR